MAVKVTLNDLDLLAYHLPLAEAHAVDEKQGWFIRLLPDALFNAINATVPTTGFVPFINKSAATVRVKRENTGGNFCGHNPAAPRFIMKNHAYFASQEIDDLGAKRRPQILYDIVERIKAYYDDPDVMPVLQVANADKRSSERQRRSESREAVVNLLTIMVMNMDLSSLRVGQPTANGGFFNYGLKWLAKKAELSFSRAKRAMSDLNDAMLIISYQYRELIDKESKTYIAHNAVRVFDRDFFKLDSQKFS